MDKKLINKFLKYSRTQESFAVLFVKNHLRKAQGHWVDIINYRHHEMSDDNLHFRYVHGGLYKRKIKPKYPPKSDFIINNKFNERQYTLLIRAITWETAHKDIEQQKSKGISPLNFKISGIRYDKNKGSKGYFLKDAPPEIKALEENLSDRTNPLWDRAIDFINKPEFIYKIKKIQIG